MRGAREALGSIQRKKPSSAGSGRGGGHGGSGELPLSAQRWIVVLSYCMIVCALCAATAVVAALLQPAWFSAAEIPQLLDAAKATTICLSSRQHLDAQILTPPPSSPCSSSSIRARPARRHAPARPATTSTGPAPRSAPSAYWCLTAAYGAAAGSAATRAHAATRRPSPLRPACRPGQATWPAAPGGPDGGLPEGRGAAEGGGTAARDVVPLVVVRCLCVWHGAWCGQSRQRGVGFL